MGYSVNILYIIEGITFGGGDRVFMQLAEGMKAKGYGITVGCVPRGVLAERLRELGIEVEGFNMYSKYNIRTIFQMAKFMKQKNIHIVHTQGGRAPVFGRIAARLAKVPIVISTNPLLIDRESHRDVNKLKRLAYLLIDILTSIHVDRFLVLSEPHREAIIADYNTEPSKVVKIYNGIELDKYDAKLSNGLTVRRELGIAPGSSIVGFIGRLIYQKGLPFFLQAASKVITTFPDVMFLIVGDGPLKAELEKLSNGLNIRQNCIFTGFRQDIPDILSAVDMLVMSSLYEGMPMVILEAMAASKPVIATNVGGIPELVKNGETGVLVPPEDVDVLAESIIDLLKNKDKAQQMGLAGRKRVEEEFDVNIMVRKTEEVYQELIREKLKYNYNLCNF
jgi:glycosyltransferase involved in cell wall biosynthesis